MSRVDLHVHSKFSDRPSEWILRRLGAPECYTPPMTVYETAMRRTMQFVTISDHNCIQGALEIAHLPNVFVSNEITTYFPDDRCKIHVLCWNITEAQFEDIQRHRQHIVDLRDYLQAEGIAHACAHPLYSINDRLSIAHFEQLLLLFNVFETMNGARNQRSNDLVAAVLRALTREQLEDMADRHGIAPVGDEPWVKGATAGSDDHSGVFIAKGFTECPYARTPAAFLDHVMARRGRAAGIDGTPLSFAHGLYSIGYQYYRDKFFSTSAGGVAPMLKVLGEVFGPAQTHFGLRGRLSYYASRLVRRSGVAAEIEFRRTVATELTDLFGKDWLDDAFVFNRERHDALNRRTFEVTSRVANELLFQFTRRFVEKLSTGSIFGSIEALSAAGPVLLGIAPYLFAFAHQSRDKQLLADISEHLLGRPSATGTTARRAWFTDALNDVNGVTRIVRTMGELAAAAGDDLTLISIADRAPDWAGSVKHFPPVGEFSLPENEGVTLAFPPFLDVLEYCDRQQFTELIVSTPGPAGLAALAAGKALNIRLVGIYHTDLPQYVRYYTEDEGLESVSWRYLRWFYEQMDVIYVPSRAYQRELEAKGFPAAKLRMFPHGTDLDRFHPDRRDPEFWRRFGAGRGPTVTYVGRVAKEKDLDVLADAFTRLLRTRPDCTLAVVGDGPFLPAMQQRLRHPHVVFTGFLFDDDLSRAYASSDVFVFPSTTDTFGNVVLEAMASGLPVVVSDRGGPREIVDHGRTGLITPARNAEHLVAAIERLLDDHDLRTSMARAGRIQAESHGWNRLYREFWQGLGSDAPAFAGAPAHPATPPHVAVV